MTTHLSTKDFEKLSAYLDDQLSARQRRQLESRLETETELRKGLRDLRQTRHLLRNTPQAKVPRNFTLSPQMAGQPTAGVGLYPTMRLVSTLASVLFVLVFVSDLVGVGSAGRTQEIGFAESAAGLAEPMEADAVEGADSNESFMDKSADPPLPAEEATEAATEELTEEPVRAATEVIPSSPNSTDDDSAGDGANLGAGAAGTPDIVSTATLLPAQTPTLDGETIEEEAPAISQLEAESGGEDMDNSPDTPQADQPRAIVPILGIRILEFGLAGLALLSGITAYILRRK